MQFTWFDDGRGGGVLVLDNPVVGGGVCEVGKTLTGRSPSLVRSGLLFALRSVFVSLDEEFACILGGPHGFVPWAVAVTFPHGFVLFEDVLGRSQGFVE